MRRIIHAGRRVGATGNAWGTTNVGCRSALQDEAVAVTIAFPYPHRMMPRQVTRRRMLFKSHILDGIASGQVTMAFRYWNRPSVVARGKLRTSVGVIAIDSVMEVVPDEISETDALHAGFESREELLKSFPRCEGRVLYRIEFHVAGEDPRVALRQDAEVSEADMTALINRLAEMDGSSKTGPWTHVALDLIAEKDGRTSGEIAQVLSVEKATLKRRIRQLKGFGLTESLHSGYKPQEIAQSAPGSGSAAPPGTVGT
jgi:hypothetical protein